MESKGDHTGIGSCIALALSDQRNLKISSGGKFLELHELSSRDRLHSACKSIITDSAGKRRIPLYNLLWLSISGETLVIEYAAQCSKTSITPETWSFPIAPGSDESNPDEFVSTVLAQAYSGSQPRKRAFVLVNPHAGPGGALRKWSKVKPLFQAAKMEMNVVVLQRGGEAAELVQGLDIEKYDTIVACSGDGTPHEIFNGLGKRSDAARALSTVAVSHIPCGSGNAMSLNLYGTSQPSLAALAIIKGHITPLDLVSMTQGDRRILSFLSQSLGLVAECDLGTENLRWMGGSRFEVGILMRILRRRCYPCDLAVKAELVTKTDVKAHYRKYVGEPHGQNSRKMIPPGQVDSLDLPPLKYGTVNDPLPDGWQMVKRETLGTFYCGNMAYMAANANFFPAALPCDGLMDLVTVDGDLNPITAAKLLYSVEHGKFFDDDHVEYKKISGYRIIPRNQKDGYISIDGERVPFEPFQAEIHQGLGRVISKKGVFESDGPANWNEES